MTNLNIDVAGMKLRNPLILASGIAGFGEEYGQLIDLNIFGAFVTKTITLKPRTGNPSPRIRETFAGMVNSIGLENPGLELFLKEKLPLLRKKIRIPVIASIAGENTEEFTEICRSLNKAKGLAALELNLSCPNVREKTTSLISQDTGLTYETVKRVKRVTGLPVIAKLSPNVTDITRIAQSAESAGADAISLVNTFSALAFPPLPNNLITQPPILGGLSGPAIKPIALRMVYETAQRVKIPIIGMGGINGFADALEFILVGAKAIALGSALFGDPFLPKKILTGLEDYLKTQKITLNKLVGKLL